MSLPKGFAAAGSQIPFIKQPASVIHFGRFSHRLMAGSFVLLITIVSLVAASGSSSIPVPPRKPDMMSLILGNQVNFSSAGYNSAEHGDSSVEGAYHSPYTGQQMDLYRDIFRFQAAGSLNQADAMISRLNDHSLMGHVLAQRYLSTNYKASFAELEDWLKNYADYPEAAKILRLANGRMPDGHTAALIKSSYNDVDIEEMSEIGMEAKAYQSNIKRTPAQNVLARDMINTIRRQIQTYEPSSALRLFNQSKATLYLDDVEKDRVRAMIASGYLYAGKLDDAETLATTAMRGSRANAPLAGWVLGLVKWRQGLYAQAASAFEVAASSYYSSGGMVSAASFWAYRSHDKSGHNSRGKPWLERASHYPRTFYGLLAMQALGRDADLNWNAPTLSSFQEHEILGTPAGQRAERLLAAGEVTLAEAEIKSLYIPGDTSRKKALLAYAYDRQLPSLSMKLAHALSAGDDEIYDSALYPSMPWTPNQGFRIDRALIHAIIRQESRFNALAENKGSGATGLMQLMPLTANYVVGADIFDDSEGRSLLKTPEVSLDIGQQYVEELLNNSMIGQDLLSLAIAYNAGPGTLAKWKAERADINDPLLFVETIPFAETRGFVERVLSNYWIYRMRFDQSNESMQALVDGRWARYAALDKDSIKFAER